MSVPDRRPLVTAEELFELRDDGRRYELVEGESIPMTPAGARHGTIAFRIGLVAVVFTATAVRSRRGSG